MLTSAISYAQLHPGTSRPINLQRTQIMRWFKREKNNLRLISISRVSLTWANTPLPGLHASATRRSTTSSLVISLDPKPMLTTFSIVRGRRRPRCSGHLRKHCPSHGRHRGAAWWENLKRVFYLKIDSFALTRNVWLCIEAPDQEGKPPCQEPSGTHQSHPVLSAWKVSMFYFSWSRNTISIRLCTICALAICFGSRHAS